MRLASLVTVVLAGVIVLSLAACGGDDEPSASPTTGPGSAATVPDVEGDDLADAAEALADEGLRAAVEYGPSSEEQGTTVGQSPDAGAELQRGDSVQLTVSAGPSEGARVRVPDALDQSADDAEATLERAGFEVLTIPVPAVSEDVVVAHSPAAGADAPRGSLVVVYAGGG